MRPFTILKNYIKFKAPSDGLNHDMLDTLSVVYTYSACSCMLHFFIFPLCTLSTNKHKQGCYQENIKNLEAEWYRAVSQSYSWTEIEVKDHYCQVIKVHAGVVCLSYECVELD